MQDQRLKNLQQLIKQSFNMSELPLLAQELNVDLEDIAGETRPEKIWSLLKHLQRRKRIAALLETLQEKRPNTHWLETATDDTPSPYRGLKAFRLEDEHLFFGREALTSPWSRLPRSRALSLCWGRQVVANRRW